MTNTNRIFLVSVVACAAVVVVVQCLILLEIDRVVLGSDEWLIMPEVDAAFRGEFDLSSYWQPHGGHHWLGYKVLFVANALLFGLNLKVFQFAGVVLWIAAGLITAFYLSRTLDFGTRLQQILAAVAVSLSFVSPHAWHLQSYSLTSWRVGNVLGYVLVFILLDRLVYPRERQSTFGVLLLFALLVVLYSLFFGRGWAQAMLVATVGLLAAAVVVNATAGRWADVGRLAMGLLVCIACVLVYHAGSYPLRDAERSSMDLVELMKFTFLLLGNTITFNSISLGGMSHADKLATIQLFGVGVLCVYGLGLFVYLKNRLYDRTVFPLALMLFSGCVVFAIYYGRGAAEGYEQAMFPRYMGDTCVGMAAAVALILANRWTRPVRLGVSAMAVLVISLHLMAIVNLKASAVFKRNFTERTYQALFSNPIEAFHDPDLARQAGCRSYQRCRWRQTLDEHGLVPRH